LTSQWWVNQDYTQT